MKKVDMKKVVAVLVLISSITLALAVYADPCLWCGHDNAKVVSTHKLEWNSRCHYMCITYTMKCPDCGDHFMNCHNYNHENHTIKVKTKKYPKLNLKVTTKYCSKTGCGYQKETYGPIDPNKPWTSPQ